MNKIKILISTLVIAIVTLVAPVGMSVVALAQPYTAPTNGACGGATGSAPGTGSASSCNNSGTTIPKVVGAVINWFSWIVGAIAVIMIMYGGFRYVTSGGDQNGVTAAKNTLLYAVIGLIVVALSQIIVKFVINASNSAIS